MEYRHFESDSRVGRRSSLDVVAVCISLVLVVIFIAAVVRGMFPVNIDSTATRLWDYRGAFCAGLFVSTALSLIAIVGGTLIGLFLAIITRAKKRTAARVLLAIVSAAYIYTFLAIPIYTLILFGYYWNALSSWSAFWIASSTLAINLSPFAAQVLQAGLANISQAEIESARAFGYEGYQLYWHFYLRSLIRSIGRPLLVQYYTTMKLSSLAAVIGVGELMHTGQIVIRATYKTEVVYLFVALGYVLMITPIAILADVMERRNALR